MKKTKKKPVAKKTSSPLWRRLLIMAAKAGLVLAIWGGIAVSILVVWYATDLPDVEEAVAATRRPMVTLVSADGVELLSVGDLYGVPVTLGELPPALPQAVMATEDRRFRDHFGIDVIGLMRAVFVNLKAGRVVQGGSTITQQVAKNLFLTPERSLKRKVQELLLSFWLENRFTKDQILTLYLNRVYLGAGTYGVEAASLRYFGHSARKVSVYEAAMLAGLLKAPSRYNPSADPERAHRRTVQVLGNMVAAGYLSSEQARAAESGKDVKLARAAERKLGRHFADWVLDQVGDFVTPGDRDLVVVTTLDSRMQAAAEAALVDLLAKEGAKVGAGDGALVAMNGEGAVLALVGGKDYRSSQFNRATQALRQPGSAFKPMVYLAALEAGMEPESPVEDRPLTIDGWSPRNFDGRNRGRMTMAESIKDSVNTVAVALTEMVGRQKVIEVARRLGLTEEIQSHPSLALGSFELSLAELTSAYAAFANGGYGVWAHGIREIRDRRGNPLYRRAGGGPGRVMPAQAAAAMTRMLQGVVDGGTGRQASLPGVRTAGKTGTSTDFRDAWFIGYTPGLVAGVWIGNDDQKPMKNVTGGGLPTRIWRDFMVSAGLSGVGGG